MSRDSGSSCRARLWLGTVLLLAATWWAAPAHAARQSASPPQTPAALYQAHCAGCHGDDADGRSRAQKKMNPAPRDFTTPQATQELTRERMIAAVKNGVPGTAMAGLKKQLSDAQIAAVVDHVRDTYMRPSVTDASRGRRIYARVCSVCHGDQGKGSMFASPNLKPAPRDFTSQAAKDELTRDRMLAAVSQGRPNTAMQGYARRFSQQDLESVVDYIRVSIMRVQEAGAGSGTQPQGAPGAKQDARKKASGHEHGDHSAHGDPNDHAAHGHGGDHAIGKDGKIDMKKPFANGLRGDPVAGQKFYDANCATCHGVKGDGQGPRAYFINPKPAVFTDAKTRAGMNRPVIYDGVALGRRGSEMPAWDKVLTPQEIADVSEYVFRAFIQSGTKNAAKKQ